MPTVTKELLTVAEAARRLQTDAGIVALMAYRGELAWVLVAGERDGGLRIPADALPPVAIRA